jgi:site-specific recombinase XerD
VSIGTEAAPARVSTIAQLADIPEEEICLSKQKSARTRRAYRLDVQHFMRTLSITSPEELRQADHKAVIAWERYMREVERAASSTIRRRLAALSSLFKHLVRYGHAPRNPVGEVERPAINRDEGTTAAFSKAQARKLLDLPDEVSATFRSWGAPNQTRNPAPSPLPAPPLPPRVFRSRIARARAEGRGFDSAREPRRVSRRL